MTELRFQNNINWFLVLICMIELKLEIQFIDFEMIHDKPTGINLFTESVDLFMTDL